MFNVIFQTWVAYYTLIIRESQSTLQS